ncbi:SecDF P1 head subdomain-containing protein [Kribbella lupini]|uniref:SecDF P1 head subdomain domain-containing protein n=1 Tax=Kribbella lupini TaxID=291602 RepID=A0ABP4L7D7_9ACTN
MTQQPPYQPPQYGPPKRNRGPLVLVGVLGVVVLVLVVLTVVVLRGNDEDPDSSQPRTPRDPAAVEFRRVVTADAGLCASPPATPGVVCGADGTGYTLGKVELDGRNVSKAEAKLSNTSWVVSLQLDDQGSKAFEQLTADVAKKSPPANQIAIVVDGKVVSAPSVMSAITGGQLEISAAQFTQEEAQKLADAIGG